MTKVKQKKVVFGAAAISQAESLMTSSKYVRKTF